MPTLIADRDLRQRSIILPEALAELKITVVGVGAIGRQVALQLAAIGAPWLQLIDFDTVENVNLASQGFLEHDIGRTKVCAVADTCSQINGSVELITREERFRRTTPELGDVLFCCVDSIDTRRLIWEAVNEHVKLFVDGRMSAEVLRVLTASDARSRRHYPTTLFAEAEAYRGACTAKSTIYCANIAAGMMLTQFTKWLRKFPVDADVTLNLLGMDLMVAEPARG